MKKTTIVWNKLEVSPLVNGEAKVILDGEEIGSISRAAERRNWYWSTVQGQPYGGGKTITNAAKAVAIGYCLLNQIR